MVYLTPDELGWRPYVKTWVNTFFTDDTIMSQDLKEYLYSIFDASIDMGLDKIRD
jgi:dynein heavy chain